MLLHPVYILVVRSKVHRVQQQPNRITPVSAADPSSSPGPRVGPSRRCVTAALRPGAHHPRTELTGEAQQNNRFLAVMHGAAVVLLTYQRTPNCLEEAVGSRPVPDVCARPNSPWLRPRFILNVLPAFLWLCSLHEPGLNLLTCTF